MHSATSTRYWFSYVAGIFLSLSILLPGFVNAQNTQPAHFTIGEDQFQGTQIYDVIQDNDYNYWFATDAGLFKYDSYSYKKTECFGMKGTSVFGFVIAANGIIYCHNLNYQIFQISHGVCSIFYELKESERSSDIYLHCTEDSSLLILTRIALLFKRGSNQIETTSDRQAYHGFPFQTNDGRTISHLANTKTLLIEDRHALSIQEFKYSSSDFSGTLKFFRSKSGVYAVNVNTKDFYRFDESSFQLQLIPECNFLDRNEYFRYYSESGKLWIAGSRSGVRLLEDPLSVVSPTLLYPQYFISDLFRDKEGNILLSTFSKGVIVVPNMAISGAIPIPGGQPAVSVVNSTFGGVLVGTQEGELLLYDSGNYTSLHKGPVPLVTVFAWPNCPFVFFNSTNPKAYFPEDHSTREILHGSLKDALLVGDSLIYLGLNTGTSKVKWNKNKEFSVEPIPHLQLRSYALAHEEISELIYVSTAEGLKALRPNGDVFELAYNDSAIYPLCMTSLHDTVFIATKRDGILVCNKGEVIRQIKIEKQRSELEISKMLIKDGFIYTIVNGSFVVYDPDGRPARTLNASLGFSSDRVTDFDVIEDKVWISHAKGIQSFSLKQLEQETTIPLLWFSEITVDSFSVNKHDNTLHFPSSKRKFRFAVSSPTLRNQQNIKYHYKLEGLDNNWNISPYAEHEFVYQSLPAGEYTLLVKAENQGKFSPTITYAFVVDAPFWSRWWFTGLIGLIIIGAVTLIYKYQLRVQERKSKLVNELYASRLTAIQSQMNPHFIFNSLNSIQDLVLKGDIDNSYTFITKFSNLVRRTLNYSDKDFVEFSQEIKLIELYLSLEKLRFKEDLDYTIEAGDIDDIMIPPMLIQPFIENSLLHGLLHKEGSKQLHIRFHLNDVLTCSIEDNGIGREKSREIKSRQRAEHESFSGEAIKKRFSILSKLFDNELGYTYEDLTEDGQPIGTRVTLTIPVKRNY